MVVSSEALNRRTTTVYRGHRDPATRYKISCSPTGYWSLDATPHHTHLAASEDRSLPERRALAPATACGGVEIHLDCASVLRGPATACVAVDVEVLKVGNSRRTISPIFYAHIATPQYRRL